MHGKYLFSVWVFFFLLSKFIWVNNNFNWSAGSESINIFIYTVPLLSPEYSDSPLLSQGPFFPDLAWQPEVSVLWISGLVSIGPYLFSWFTSLISHMWMKDHPVFNSYDSSFSPSSTQVESKCKSLFHMIKLGVMPGTIYELFLVRCSEITPGRPRDHTGYQELSPGQLTARQIFYTLHYSLSSIELCIQTTISVFTHLSLSRWVKFNC